MDDANPRLSMRLYEAASALGVSEKLLKRACQQKLIRCAKMGKVHTIPVAEVERLSVDGFPSPAADLPKPKPPGSRAGRPRRRA